MATPNKPKASLDLQNLDPEQIVKLLIENQDTIIKLILIAGSLMIAGMMFNGHRVKDAQLRAKTADIQQKVAAIKDRDANSQALTKFKSELPKTISEFELITFVSDAAKMNHIAVPSLSPTENAGQGMYDTINLIINGDANSFKDLMFFLRKIEKSEYPIRVDSWSGHPDDNGHVMFSMQISAVIIHK